MTARHAQPEPTAPGGASAGQPLLLASIRDLAPLSLLALLLAALAIYFVGVEQGALSVFGGREIHELVHDSRHLLAFPCH